MSQVPAGTRDAGSTRARLHADHVTPVKPDPLHFGRAWLVVGALLVAFTIWFSLGTVPPAWAYTWGEQGLHAGVYALLVFWFGQLYSGAWRQGMVVAGFVAMGIGLELLQAEMTTVRRLDMVDMLSNAGGAAGAWLALRTPAGRCLQYGDRWLARRLGCDAPDGPGG